MAKLDLYEGREPHTIILEVEGEKKEFKAPSDFTEEEIERLLEFEEKLAKEKNIDNRYDIFFEQIFLLFRRYNPEMTVEFLKKHLSRNEVLKILNFVAKNNFAIEAKNSEGENTSKKKLPK